ncbi:head fiber protein [Edwardsiella tarda]|uniref:head fiber protein n=1 Tax=Edwardsiella tarda TaxID=636 RepID=UPI003A84CF4A
MSVPTAQEASAAVTAATPTVMGAVKQAAAIPDLTAAPTQADFNGLLAKLRAAGVMAS